MRQELAPELRRGEIRGVDDPIRLPPDGLHEPPLPADGLLQRAAVSLQGMETAGLLIAVDDGLRQGLQEEEAARRPFMVRNFASTSESSVSEPAVRTS